jgi:hypothetical protein
MVGEGIDEVENQICRKYISYLCESDQQQISAPEFLVILTFYD